MARTETNGQIDRGLLPLYLSLSLVCIRMGEVGREANHRGLLTGVLDQSCDWIHIGGREAAKEPVVVFNSLPSKTTGIADPLIERRSS